MPVEAKARKFYQGSDSNAYVPRTYVFSQSGLGEDSEIVTSVNTPQTSGASELADTLVRETIEFLQDLYSAQSYQRDPSIARGLIVGHRFGIVSEMVSTPEKRRPSDVTEGSFCQSTQQIQLALESDPVEDGYTHPAEIHLANLIKDGDQEAGDWLTDMISGYRWNPSLAAGLLRVLGRQKPFTEEWRLRVIQSALSSPDIELRDAGIQAAELWGDPGAVKLLQEHNETCTWLADYVRRVIRDLTR